MQVFLHAVNRGKQRAANHSNARAAKAGKNSKEHSECKFSNSHGTSIRFPIPGGPQNRCDLTSADLPVAMASVASSSTAPRNWCQCSGICADKLQLDTTCDCRKANRPCDRTAVAAVNSVAQRKCARIADKTHKTTKKFQI